MNAAFDALVVRFRQRCADDLDRLRELSASEASGDDLHRLAHGIAGAAGTFGFPDLSDAAAAVDDDYASGQTPSGLALARLDDALAAAALR